MRKTTQVRLGINWNYKNCELMFLIIRQDMVAVNRRKYKFYINNRILGTAMRSMAVLIFARAAQMDRAFLPQLGKFGIKISWMNKPL